MRLRLPLLLVALAVVVAALAGIAPSAGADSSTWAVAANPSASLNSTSLTQVSCSSDTLCVAIGSYLTESWDGTSWSVDSPPSAPTAVSCAPSTTFCMAVGSAGFESFDGSTWTAVASSVPLAQAVSCATASYCVAVGATPIDLGVSQYIGPVPTSTTVETWNGSDWVSDPVPPAFYASDPPSSGYDFGEISCPDVDFCELAGQYDVTTVGDITPGGPLVAVTDTYPAAVSWDGSTWSNEPPDDTSGGAVTGLSCSSATYCLTNVGGTSFELNGTPLAAQPPHGGPAAEGTWEGFSCPADDDCVLVGSHVGSSTPGVNSEVDIVAFDGTSWTAETAPVVTVPNSQLTAVSCLTDGFCVGVGNENTSLPSGIPAIFDTPLIETTGTMPAPDDAAVTLSVSPTPPVTGPVTYTVDLAGSPAPTGSVTIATQGQTCTGTVISGQGSCTIVEHASGGQTEYIDVEFSGDETYTPEVVMEEFSDVIGQATPDVTVTPSSDPAPNGDVAYEVGVTGLGATATGTVSVTDGTHTCTRTLASGTASCSFAEAAGPYTITATYGGDTNYLSATGSGTETVEQAPSFTSPNAATATAGTPFTDTVTTYSPTATPHITSSVLPLGLHLVDNGDGTATIDGTPASHDSGMYKVTLSAAVEGRTTGHQVLHLTVDNRGAFIAMPAHTVTAGRAFTYPIVTRYGYPTPSITTASTLPAGVTLTDHGNGTASLAGTPSLTSGGVYHLTFTATNGVGAPVTDNLTLTVNQPPVITSPDTDTIVAGATMTPFAVTATGYPTPRLSAAGLPAGLRLSDGEITGKVTAAQARTYDVTIVATSAAGTTSQAFTLVVDP